MAAATVLSLEVPVITTQDASSRDFLLVPTRITRSRDAAPVGPDPARYVVIRATTSYFLTDVRVPGVSSRGIALSVASPVA
jgi:hypothetical protein